jgi:ATP/ADP translocase
MAHTQRNILKSHCRGTILTPPTNITIIYTRAVSLKYFACALWNAENKKNQSQFKQHRRRKKKKTDGMSSSCDFNWMLTTLITAPMLGSLLVAWVFYRITQAYKYGTWNDKTIEYCAARDLLIKQEDDVEVQRFFLLYRAEHSRRLLASVEAQLNQL